ncbi:hypothetical protein BDP55DRAFT_766124 [Colletotrichum godetiae]|uniref:Uncharacterized protein n=1 Tax=Colletotrichum godetiae TaxID=1209918 RepID=A0AAJ0EVX9_9PEZI|nr:uncharacterized protein BDP55DRAFT_766124 [Colletotrichum godetiae]KAK1689274.1 hypothetical protein BDP55DRAFT_766124 [Colletotrichum godetiae]
MPVATRKRLGRPTKSQAAGDDDKALPTSRIDELPAGTRRSKRLGHVDVEDIRHFEAIRVKRRRRSQKAVEGGEEEEEEEEDQVDTDQGSVIEDDQGDDDDDQGTEDGQNEEGEDGEEAIDDHRENAALLLATEAPAEPPTARKRGRPRKIREDLRVDTLRKEATNTHRTNASRVGKGQTTQESSRSSRMKAKKQSKGLPNPEASQPTPDPDNEDEPAATAKVRTDNYEFASSPPRGSAVAVDLTMSSYQEAESSDSRSDSENPDTGNGLFVEREIQSADEQGTYEEGTYEEGTYEEGTYEEGTYEEGTYEEGTYEEGTYEEGTDEEGTDEEGTDEEGTEKGDEEGDDDEQLYNDPTMAELPPSAQAREDAAYPGDTDSQMEPQPVEATAQIRRFVGDLDPPTPDLFPEVDYEYPDDHFIFHKPEDQDRLTAAPVKSPSLKSIKELMNGVGWTRSKDGRAVDLTTGPAQLSQKTQPLWDRIQSLNIFWEGAPRAPLFSRQCDYLHSINVDAVDARLTFKEVDKLVHKIATKAKKPSPGDESDMPAPRFVKELYESIIPLLVVTLGNVFRKGTDHDGSQYAGTFTKPMLQIMHRLVAWIQKLYYGMLSNLARRRQKEQLLSKKLSREKLAVYLKGFKLELDMTWNKVNHTIQRQRLYEQRSLEKKQKEQRERHEYEETRRRQREFCDRRLEERIAAEKARRGISSPQQSQRGRHERQQRVPVNRHLEATRGSVDAEPCAWPEADAKWLLQTLSARPDTDSQALAMMLERSEDDVIAMISLLKQSARAHAAQRGKEVPAFAAV